MALFGVRCDFSTQVSSCLAPNEHHFSRTEHGIWMCWHRRWQMLTELHSIQIRSLCLHRNAANHVGFSMRALAIHQSVADDFHVWNFSWKHRLRHTGGQVSDRSTDEMISPIILTLRFSIPDMVAVIHWLPLYSFNWWRALRQHSCHGFGYFVCCDSWPLWPQAAPWSPGRCCDYRIRIEFPLIFNDFIVPPNSFVLVMEIIGTEWRELVSVLYQVPFNLGHLTLPLFAYFLRDWHYLQFALSIPSIVLISYYWLVPESPRWLFTVGRIDESSAVLEKAAAFNSLPTESIKMDLEKHAVHTHGGANVSRGNILDLVRTPNMRSKTLAMCFNWFVCGLSFFGVAQYIGQSEGDIFSNVATSAALEMPGTLLCIYTMRRFGRKLTLFGSNTLAGICMLSVALYPTAQVPLASVALIGMSISFPTIYLYAGELFPTVVRNVGIGTASMIARIGSMVAPFLVSTKTYSYVLPPIILGVIPIIGALLVLLLPETVGQPLPATIEDGENFGKKQPSTKSWICRKF